jgi:hypothetical protein
MSNHVVVKCSCGAVIAQCRCYHIDKAEKIQQDGCRECRAKMSAKVVPLFKDRS